jgi:hypothetical protein
MNDPKLKNLFAAARKETPPTAPEGLDLLVLQAIRREPARSATTLWDSLHLLFPRYAWAAVSVIAVCVAGDWLAATPSLTDGVAQLSQQWLLAGTGF